MKLEKFTKKINSAGLDKIVEDAFGFYYKQIQSGATGKLGEDTIVPPSEQNVIDYDKIELNDPVQLEKLAVIKLNGGLGTSMGLSQAKTLLPVKNDLNFLDIIALQILQIREQTNKKIPLIFMHSFNTQDDCLEYLEKYPNLKLDSIPLDFLQNKFPKLKQSDLTPFEHDDDSITWNPPGHGEIYMTLAITGTLDKLIANGIEYLFLSNSDNLGAIVDYNILGYFAENEIPFMMEVCTRSEMDKKGGHLAESKSGHLLLRETAQCPADEITLFEDVNRYKYFNTNNLWVNLKALKQKLDQNGNFLPLSLIINPKNLDGTDVYQLESAMGAAISIFDNSKAICVHRDRFAPVKKTNELLAIRSDAFQLTDNYHLTLSEQIMQPPVIDLDEKFYKYVSDFDKHFPNEVPSLIDCQRLEIKGDITFGSNVKIIGNVKLDASKPTKIENQVIK